MQADEYHEPKRTKLWLTPLAGFPAKRCDTDQGVAPISWEESTVFAHMDKDGVEQSPESHLAAVE
jgi:hypothetical protein